MKGFLHQRMCDVAVRPRRPSFWRTTGIPACSLLVVLYGVEAKAAEPINVVVNWDNTVAISKTVPTVFVSPGSTGRSDHEEVLTHVKTLGTNYVRLVLPETPLGEGMAELEPPTREKTSWDFGLMDTNVATYLEALKGQELILNLRVPPWMRKNFDPAFYASLGTLKNGKRSLNQDDLTLKDFHDFFLLRTDAELTDPTGKQLAAYFADVVSWYTQGGFRDEQGKFHRSGYHLELPWFEVLNEVQPYMTPQQYVVIYDAVVSAVHRVSPQTKFEGLALAPMGHLNGYDGPAREPEFFEYFLNPKNHQPGIPLDMVAYHFYAIPALSQTMESWQYTFFDQADGFLNDVDLIESIRKRLSPSTRVNIDELGIILPKDHVAIEAMMDSKTPSETVSKISESISEISAAYRNLSGALDAYVYLELAKRGIDVVTASALLPRESRVYPSINLIDPKAGTLNARFWVLKLLVENFHPTDQLVETTIDGVFGVPPDVDVQAFKSSVGKKLLVVNKRMYGVELDLGKVGQMRQIEVVDESSADGPARREMRTGDSLHLGPFAVGVVTLDH